MNTPPLSFHLVDDPALDARDVIALYASSGIVRPIDDEARIAKMYAHSNLVVAARDDAGALVGVARALTDFSYCCYLSDLAVLAPYQSRGVGRALVERVKARIGDTCMLLLLSAKGAMDYYPKLGFDVVQNGFILKRRR